LDMWSGKTTFPQVVTSDPDTTVAFGSRSKVSIVQKHSNPIKRCSSIQGRRDDSDSTL